MSPSKEDQIIRKTFRVKGRDTLPFTGWSKPTRHNLAQMYNTLGYKVGAEIGVQRGLNAKTLFRNVKGLKLICVDPWSPYNRQSVERTNNVYKNCLNRLKNHDVEYMRMTSMEAAKKVPDRSLDFVYIDGLHDFDSVMRNIICWARKVRFGGIVAGHDYYTFYQGGIIQAVNAYTLSHNINDWYITNGDEFPSFFWVQKEEYQQGYSF